MVVLDPSPLQVGHADVETHISPNLLFPLCVPTLEPSFVEIGEYEDHRRAVKTLPTGNWKAVKGFEQDVSIRQGRKSFSRPVRMRNLVFVYGGYSNSWCLDGPRLPSSPFRGNNCKLYPMGKCKYSRVQRAEDDVC